MYFLHSFSVFLHLKTCLVGTVSTVQYFSELAQFSFDKLYLNIRTNLVWWYIDPLNCTPPPCHLLFLKKEKQRKIYLTENIFWKHTKMMGNIKNIYIYLQVFNAFPPPTYFLSRPLSSFPHWKDTIPKFETNIPREGIAYPQSQFPYSCACERIIYSHNCSVNSAVGKYVDRS